MGAIPSATQAYSWPWQCLGDQCGTMNSNQARWDKRQALLYYLSSPISFDFKIIFQLVQPTVPKLGKKKSPLIEIKGKKKSPLIEIKAKLFIPNTKERYLFM